MVVLGEGLFFMDEVTLQHSGLRRHFPPIFGRESITVSVGTPLCPYGIAYRESLIEYPFD